MYFDALSFTGKSSLYSYKFAFGLFTINHCEEKLRSINEEQIVNYYWGLYIKTKIKLHSGLMKSVCINSFIC